MTRQQFEVKAIRIAERKLYVPAGWWGTYRDVTNGTVRVRFSGHGHAWIVSCAKQIISRHDSRTFAIQKARRLTK